MRFIRFAGALLLPFALHGAVAAAHLGTSDYFTFANWSDAVIDAGGQTFTGLGVDGDVDVTVRINNDFNNTGTTSSANGWIFFGHEEVGSDSIIFDFSKPIVPLVKVRTVDQEENLRVFTSSSTHSYEHISGLTPTVTQLSGGLQLNGQGFGSDVSSGEIYGSDPVSRITVTHEALSSFKYDAIQVGQVIAQPVPEPNSAGILFIGLLAFLSLRGKR